VAGGRISWVSPLARALLKLREGEVAMLRTPTGINELEVTCIAYCELD
jgi:transcription elongation factor GreB